MGIRAFPRKPTLFAENVAILACTGTPQEFPSHQPLAVGAQRAPAAFSFRFGSVIRPEAKEY
ncbi:MAG: hypothetical protein A2991_01645 [Candidatus Terrybacteria bacterium RIFCSPLOWO2_01_FULL_58_14]|uniref:Uncharacterized protein n=2 Tax=Candidatus Terryibacteriota TaxID=1817920 RepID=A0A1G2PY84_9BACT|nr:MAG: hypothetical protein A2682_02230 [Candidatus Terrybacteria bacterium RIFCSPHIGHO2_01_FULL_58_15]OHA53263.1 MAG: hypothetical protein A2991_01645 [Candidatus Terrybacteria bacterium RIFCSPLOWO2_01_FULL_58_14]